MMQAIDEARKRLKVRRLHREPRRTRKRSALPIQGRYGSDWKELTNWAYKAVPRSHRDFDSAGGCSIHEIRRQRVDTPFDPSTLFKLK
jgi:hypothetical protein